MLFAFIHLVEGILSAYLSKQNSNAFSEHTMKSLARADMEFFETHDLIVVALKSNKDFEDTFTITYYFQTVLRNSLLFLATYIGVTIETPEFWAIGLIVLLCGVTLYLNFSRAERDVMRYYTPTYEESQKELEQYIDGLDTIKPLGTAKV
jgi:ABC-type multidrug transport system fused ATPase/permease subunit